LTSVTVKVTVRAASDGSCELDAKEIARATACTAASSATPLNVIVIALPPLTDVAGLAVPTVVPETFTSVPASVTDPTASTES